MHNTSILSTIGWILSQVPLRLKNITMKIVHLFKILRVVLPLLILSTGISDPHEGHLVKTATNGQVYFINDSKRLPVRSTRLHNGGNDNVAHFLTLIKSNLTL